MANCCLNWFNIKLNKEHKSFKEFIKKTEIFKRAESISSSKGRMRSITKEADGCFFDLQFNSLNLEEGFGGSFGTNWSPIKTSILTELMNNFECIKEIEVIYEENGCCVGGVLLLEREENGEIQIDEREASCDYWNLVTMREMAWDGYKDMAHCSEVTGLSEDNIMDVLRLSKIQLSHFTDKMECFDVEDYSA